MEIIIINIPKASLLRETSDIEHTQIDTHPLKQKDKQNSEKKKWKTKIRNIFQSPATSERSVNIIVILRPPSLSELTPYYI